MRNGSVRVFRSVRTFSTGAAFGGAILSLIFSSLFSTTDLGWQIAVATIALALGIPHGAIDHLISLPRKSLVVMSVFISLYVLLAVIAGAAIFSWNVIGFQLVLIMSFLHFGFGDTSYLAELRALSQDARSARSTQFFYALSAGAVPVFIPLTSPQSERALRDIHPSLVNWAGTSSAIIRWSVILLALLTLLLLVFYRQWRTALDLIALLALAFFAPPLIAFAIYFGCWHAMRHTARLTLLLPKALAKAQEDKPRESFMAAVIPGLPALVGALILALVLIIAWNEKFSTHYLWNLLVIVWALTVPHMLVTARIDTRVLKK